MKIIRRILIAVVIAAGIGAWIVAFGWNYTSTQLAIARARGVYASPEQGMIANAGKDYTPDMRVKILYTGTNSFDGSDPFVWYVIAEVRASARADGSDLGQDGCDAPGSFFLQTKEGWVYVKEGQFPTLMGFWMKLFDWAGEGQSTPSTNWAPDQNPRFCTE